MRKLPRILAAIGAVGAVAAVYAFRPPDIEAWRADYLEPREILAGSYANLGYASETGLSLRASDQPQWIKYISNLGNPSSEIGSNELAADACSALGYDDSIGDGYSLPPVTRNVALSLGVSLSANAQSRAAPLDAVIVAHQDDWQLFMGDVVARRVQMGGRVIFLYLTAGDDGRDSLYWATRERGALESTRVAVGVATTDSATDQCSIVRTLDHAIRKCTIANTESYFFRLPDGHRNGIGFARHSYQSLRKLRRRRITTISAVDGSAAYNSWADVMSTVGVLIGESSADRIVTVHTSDPSVVVNPHDHFDHRMAGLLVYDSRKENRWNVVYYTGYALATRVANRSGDQVRQKTSLFIAYDKVMTTANAKWSAYRERPAFYSECMLRTYARRITSP